MPRLEMRTGKNAGKSYDLTKPVILGRGDNVGIRVHDIKASREHCRVFEQGGKWIVADLNSRNGITVNGAKTTRKDLISGDQIAIGETVLAFVDEAAAGQPKPAARAPEPGEIMVDEIDLGEDDGAPARPAARQPAAQKPAARQPAAQPAVRGGKGSSAKDAAFAAARADAARKAQGGGARGGGGGGSSDVGLQVSDRVLQFNKVDAKKSSPLSMDLSQYPVVVQIAIVGGGFAVLAIAFWLIVR